MTVELGRLDQTHDRGGPLARRFGTGEQPVLAPQRDGPDRVLDRIIIDRVGAIVEIGDSGTFVQKVTVRNPN